MFLLTGVTASTLALGWLTLIYWGPRRGPVLGSIDTEDHSVKASLFETDCGAMTALRVNIALSNSFVDGARFGDPVLIMLNVRSRDVQMQWFTRRDLVVSYPKTAEVEFAIAKIRGVRITLKPE